MKKSIPTNIPRNTMDKGYGRQPVTSSKPSPNVRVVVVSHEEAKRKRVEET